MANEAKWIGVILILFGIFLLGISRFHIVAIIYGGMAIIAGISIILFNKEDKIEERKDFAKSLKHLKSKK